MVARVPVLEVRPCLDRGRFPAKVVPGEPLTVEALVLPDTVDVGAAVVLTAPDGKRRDPVPMRHLGDHVWSATVTADAVGAWTYHVESWQESLRTWAGRVVTDIDHGADPETVLAQGSALVLALGNEDPAALEVGDDLLDTTTPAHERLAEGLAYVASLPEHLGRADVGSTRASSARSPGSCSRPSTAVPWRPTPASTTLPPSTSWPSSSTTPPAPPDPVSSSASCGEGWTAGGASGR